MYSADESVEILGKFETLINSYDYIYNYSKINNFKMIMDLRNISEYQKKGSIISVNNLKKPSKLIYLRSDVSKRRKLTM
jgi:hypothetical protein